MTGTAPAAVPDGPGEPVTDLGYMSLPAGVQQAAEASLQPPAGTDEREPLGRLVHGTRSAFAAKVRPLYVPVAWEQRLPEQRELDMLIGEAVAAEALRQHEDGREELILARLSRSVRLARIAAHCRRHLELPGSCCPHLAEDILAIIGSEEGEDRG